MIQLTREPRPRKTDLSEAVQDLVDGKSISVLYSPEQIDRVHRRISGELIFKSVEQYVGLKNSGEKDKAADVRRFLVSHSIFHQLANVSPDFLDDRIDRLTSDDLDRAYAVRQPATQERDPRGVKKGT